MFQKPTEEIHEQNESSRDLWWKQEVALDLDSLNSVKAALDKKLMTSFYWSNSG